MTAAEPQGAGELDALLEHIRASRGFDFSGYKRPSLERRLRKRLEAVGAGTYADYQDFLEVNPEEFTDLFNTILINVTGFFRDPESWQNLAEEILPKMIAAKGPDEQIRVWSAACASGEEAYTIAMLLAEQLGEAAFRARVKIYATDVDEEALAIARQAVYPRDAMKAVPEDLVEKYWDRAPSGHVFRSDLRRSVIFGRNDLVQDAPISRTDLLISRNALMYFTPETQASILGHFNFSLTDAGFLFLGKSEMLLTHSALFKPYDLKWRIFTKVPRAGVRDRLSFLSPGLRQEQDEPVSRYAQIRDGAADIAPIAQVVLDANGTVAFANRAARTIFALRSADIGRPVQDLELSYRPIELRAALAEAQGEQRTVPLGQARWGGGPDGSRTYEVEVAPINGSGAGVLGASITFADVTERAQLAERFEESRRQLETAYEELQSTVEELETTNEELQSTNEELETTNEELQSTNEELETMNEELHSTNEELETMNEAQRERASEVDKLNMFLEGILGSLGVGIVVVDQEQKVQLWSTSATALWGLRDDEVAGQHFMTLEIGLPTDHLREPIKRALADGGQESAVAVEAVNRRGRHFTCTVRTLPLVTRDGDAYGAILLMSGEDGHQAPEVAKDARGGDEQG